MANTNFDVRGGDMNSLNAAQGRGPIGVDFKPWFGEPPKKIDISPYDAFKRENLALPEAYHGKNYYMSTIMIQAITEDDMWATSLALPFVESNSMDIEWEEITFDRPLLGPVPEEGVSRLVTASTASRRESHQRYGIAFTLEHGFMNTDKGRRWYAGNIQQIKNAVLETAYQLVIEAYLACKLPSQVWNEKYGSRTFHSVRDAKELEISEWACIQKDDFAWQMLDTKLKKQMRKHGATPDMWILPEGMKTYIMQVRKENRDFFGPAAFNTSLNGQVKNTALDIANDCALFEAKEFSNADTGDESIMPLSRRRSVGEYYLMRKTIDPRTTDKPYVSKMRNIMIYDESSDRFEELSIRTAIGKCPIFHEETGSAMLTASDDDSGGKPAFNAHYFKGERNAPVARPALYVGEINSKGLPEVALDDMAFTIKNLLKKNIPTLAEDTLDSTNMDTYVRNTVKQFCEKNIFLSKKFDGEDYISKLLGIKRDPGQAGLSTFLEGGDELIKLYDPAVHGNFVPKDKPDDLRGLFHLVLTRGQNPSKDGYEVDIRSANFTRVVDFDPVTDGSAQERKHLTELYNKLDIVFTENQMFMLIIEIFGKRFVQEDFNKSGYKALLVELDALSQKVIADTTPPTGEGSNDGLVEVQFDPKTTVAPAGARMDLVDYLDGVRSDPDQTIHAIDHGRTAYDASRELRSFDDTSTLNMPELSIEFRRRWDNSKNIVSSVDKLCYQIAMGVPFTKHAFDSLVSNNIVVPMSFIVFRPHMVYQMASAVIAKMGTDTGASFYMPGDFQLADDVAQKLHYGNYTQYLKPVVMRHQNVAIAEDIMCQRYISGNDMKFFKTHEEYTRFLENSDAMEARSIIVAPIPYEREEGSMYPNPMDITGRVAEGQARFPRRLAEDYESAEFIKAYFGIEPMSVPDPSVPHFSQAPTLNTLCFSGCYSEYNTTTDRVDLFNEGTGHWAKCTYQGCARVRNGASKAFERIEFTSNNGGHGRGY